ncbi:hypothetical protein [Coxiella burnetii]|nr:hypothetical protein [Coxiella burnetii]
MAKSHPNLNYLGVEVYRPGIASLLLGLEKEVLPTFVFTRKTLFRY